MLTLKLITEETERVIKGLEKKHFQGAKEAVEKAIAIDKQRRDAQTKLDAILAESKKYAAQIGQLMKAGKKDEAEAAKAEVAKLKASAADLETVKANAEQELTTHLCTIPNIPYDEVPEGSCAEDNVVVKSSLRECKPGDTVGNWDTIPNNGNAKLPHWELAKKYNLIDFDLGVKITGAGFPVYIGKGAQLQRALINFFLAEARWMTSTLFLRRKYLSPTSIVMSFSMRKIFPSRIVPTLSVSVAKQVLTARMCVV